VRTNGTSREQDRCSTQSAELRATNVPTDKQYGCTDIYAPHRKVCALTISTITAWTIEKPTSAPQLRLRTQETEEKWPLKPRQSTKASLTTQARENGVHPFESTANTNISAFLKTKSRPLRLMMKLLKNITVILQF